MSDILVRNDCLKCELLSRTTFCGKMIACTMYMRYALRVANQLSEKKKENGIDVTWW